MQLISKTFTALRNVSMAVVFALTASPAVMAQITVTNATFPAAGDVLKTAIASNPAIGIAAYTAPGFNLFWDLSGLQPGVLKNTSFQLASQGTVGAQVPGAELFAVTSPGSEEYYNVTANKFETQYSYGKFYDVVPNYLGQYSPPMVERNAPMNFFDIYQSTAGMIAGSVCVPVADDGIECSFPPSEFPPALVAALPAQPISLRYRLTINRIEAVDAYGTISIPGGTYNVLRLKRTQYRETRLDGKYAPLGWLDITANAIPAGFQGLGVDTIVTYFFYNDVVKEPIAVVTFNNELNAATQVIYKYNAPANPPLLSINDVTQNEGNSGSTNFTFTVSLSAPAPASGITFDIATANNTATIANSDYVAKSLTSQTIPAGNSSYTFNVTVNGDAVVEPNETFFVNVTNIAGATVSDGQALGTITNDDGACNPPVVTEPKLKQPTCEVPVGQIAVKATAASTMQYSIDNGATFKNTASFKNLAAGSYNIVVRILATPDCKTVYASNPVIINPVPGLIAPTSIIGAEGVCRNTTGQVFSTDPVQGATSYQWTLPTGATGGSTTNSISVNFNSGYTSGNICVKAVNACVQSPTYCRQIKYYNAKPATPGAIAGKTIGLCSDQTYSIAPVPDATTYNWLIPAKTTIKSGQGTPQIVLSFTKEFESGTLSVSASNCKGSSAAQSAQLYRNPDAPASISGPISAVCAGSTQIYSCPLVTGATQYTWKVPADAVINSGQGTNSISVNFKPAFVQGTISVTSGTSCATKSAAKSITVNSKPSAPAAIVGPASFCPSATGLNYSTTAVAGVTYNWLVPNGASITMGQGTAAIKVNMGTKAGNVKVSANNACGASSYTSLAVSLLSCTAAANTTAKPQKIPVGKLPEMRLWPNPATSILNVQLSGYTGNVTLQLRDLEGKLLKQEKIQVVQAKTVQQKMDIATLSSGVYLLAAIDEKGNIRIEKVIVSR